MQLWLIMLLKSQFRRRARANTERSKQKNHNNVLQTHHNDYQEPTTTSENFTTMSIQYFVLLFAAASVLGEPLGRFKGKLCFLFFCRSFDGVSYHIAIRVRFMH